MEQSERGTAPAAWHSYRCPVCGHTGEVELDGALLGTVQCSHCATALELLSGAPDQAAVTVKVASRWRRPR